jgi:P27 family predicted phage terminase small subunit
MSTNIGKPSLTVVDPASTYPPPPRKLGHYGRALWDDIMRENQIEDRGGIELLAQICATLDRAESLAEAINKDGATYHTRAGVPKAHPAIKDELACRAFIARNLQRLGITVEAVKTVGRPATGFGWRGHDNE